MKCAFLYNPNSGRGKIEKKLHYIQKCLLKKYSEVHLYATQSIGDLKEKVRAFASEYDAIIFSGGDGTFNHVLHAMEGTKVALGYIPSGTVNDIARSIGIPRTVKGALKVILRGNSELLDCMQINGKYYAMYVSAAGAFTSATYLTDQRSKRAFGAFAYLLQAVKSNLKFDVFPVKVTCGETELQTHAVLVLVLNGRSVAGFPINQRGSMKDGELETVIIRQVRKPNFWHKVGAMLSLACVFAFGCRIRQRDILFLKGKEVEIQTQNGVIWDFDGEEGCKGQVKICACPQAVKLFVPKK